MNTLVDFIKVYWIQIIIGLILFSTLIITLIKLDRNGIRKKQLKVLQSKNINPILIFSGKGITNFDLYLDEQTQKIIIFDKKIIVYNYNQLKDLTYGKTVIDGRFFYNIDFKLNDKEYKLSLKGKINGNDKVKYEELKTHLDKIQKYNETKELEKISKKTNKTKPLDKTKTTKKTKTKKYKM